MNQFLVKLDVVCRAHTGGRHRNLYRLVIERPGTGVTTQHGLPPRMSSMHVAVPVFAL